MVPVGAWRSQARGILSLGVGRAVDRRGVNAGQRGANGVSVVVMSGTTPREGTRAGRWAPRAVWAAGGLFRGQSEQAVEQFVFLGPAWQGQADQFQAAAADVVAEGQAHQQRGDQRTINLDHHACGFVAQRLSENSEWPQLVCGLYLGCHGHGASTWP